MTRSYVPCPSPQLDCTADCGLCLGTGFRPPLFDTREFEKAGFDPRKTHTHHGDPVTIVAIKIGGPGLVNITVAYTSTGYEWDLSVTKAGHVLIPV